MFAHANRRTLNLGPLLSHFVYKARYFRERHRCVCVRMRGETERMWIRHGTHLLADTWVVSYCYWEMHWVEWEYVCWVSISTAYINATVKQPLSVWPLPWLCTKSQHLFHTIKTCLCATCVYLKLQYTPPDIGDIVCLGILWISINRSFVGCVYSM